MNKICMVILIGCAMAMPFTWVNGRPSVGERFTYKTVGERELGLYVVRPDDWKATDSRPAIVFYHGGGWARGGPYQFNEHSKYLATRGVICIQVEYRLIRKGETPKVCIHDAKSAMRWVRSQAKNLGVDPNRIASGGGSAGGHLAAFVAMVDGMDDPQDDLTVSAKSNAMLLFNPVLDNGPGGYGYNRVKKAYQEYSPFHHVSEDDPPAVFFLGDQDKLIPVQTAQRFKEKMEAVGNDCEVEIFKTMPHSFFNYSKYDHVPYYKTILTSDRFLERLGWVEGNPTLDVTGVDLNAVESYMLESAGVGRTTDRRL